MSKLYIKKRKPWELPKRDYNKEQGQGRKITPTWFYNSKAWKRIREVKLKLNPFCECEDCKRRNRILQANTVDHIIPINPIDPYDTQNGKYGEPLLLSNLQSMTARCHNKKSGREAHRDRGIKL